jgi:hypothetical protein
MRKRDRERLAAIALHPLFKLIEGAVQQATDVNLRSVFAMSGIAMPPADHQELVRMTRERQLEPKVINSLASIMLNTISCFFEEGDEVGRRRMINELHDRLLTENLAVSESHRDINDG